MGLPLLLELRQEGSCSRITSTPSQRHDVQGPVEATVATMIQLYATVFSAPTLNRRSPAVGCELILSCESVDISHFTEQHAGDHRPNT